MFAHEITLASVALTVFWALLTACLLGLAWSCGCALWNRIAR